MNMETFKAKARVLMSIREEYAVEENPTEYFDGYSLVFRTMDDRRIAISYNKFKKTWKATELNVKCYGG